MIPSLQPSRPKYPPNPRQSRQINPSDSSPSPITASHTQIPYPSISQPTSSPLYQQQIRASTTISSVPSSHTSSTFPGPPSSRPQPPSSVANTKPRTQIEAMPPHSQPLPIKQPPHHTPNFDPSTRHPVFFTSRLQKPPSGVNAGWTQALNPVAWGYVFNDGVPPGGSRRGGGDGEGSGVGLRLVKL